MNKMDEYWFWIMRAISAPNLSPIDYFYDTKNDQLFSFTIENDKYKPEFRNEYSERIFKNKELLSAKVKLILDNAPYLVKLHRLSVIEKRNHLLYCSSFVADISVRQILEKEASSFTEVDMFKFKYDIKKYNPSLYQKVDIAIGSFLAKMAEDTYTPLGITSNTRILW